MSSQCFRFVVSLSHHKKQKSRRYYSHLIAKKTEYNRLHNRIKGQHCVVWTLDSCILTLDSFKQWLRAGCLKFICQMMIIVFTL